MIVLLWGGMLVKFRRLIASVCCLFLLLALLPVNGFAVETRSQDEQRVLEGGKRDLKWPVPGRYFLTSCFMDSRALYSLDIDGHRGDAVVASYEGEVQEIYNRCTHDYAKTTACCNNSNFGNYVLIRHSYLLKSGRYITLYTRYSHLKTVTVTVGQNVLAGDTVGTVGCTGISAGEHLGYEILYGGETVESCYSIDPYANELLELPANLDAHIEQCCQEYAAFARELYAQCAHMEYDPQEGKCTSCGAAYDWNITRDSSVMGLYVVVEDAASYTVPYERGTPVSLEKGRVITVQAVVINVNNQRWYEVAHTNGTITYLQPEFVLFVDYLQSEIAGGLSTLANGQHIYQGTRRLDGKVVSRYPLRAMTGYLDGEIYATWEGTGTETEINLRNTALNQKLYFSQLSIGEHTLEITAADSTGRTEEIIITCNFRVVRYGSYLPPVNQNPADSFVYIEDLPVSDYEPKIVVAYVMEQTAYNYIEKGENIGALPDLGQENPDFLGWFTSERGGQRVTEETVPETHVTLYPRWGSDVCIITYDDTELEVPYGATFNPPELTREGFVFLGWYNADGEKVGNELIITEDVTLRSKWEIEMCIVTLDPAGGTIENDQVKIGYGEPYGTLPTPVRKGYRFTGWQLRGRAITENFRVTEKGNHTLVAVWEKEDSPIMWIVPIGAAIAGVAACVLYILHRRRKMMEEAWERGL